MRGSQAQQGKKPLKANNKAGRRVSYVTPTRTSPPELDSRVQYITSFWCQVQDPASHDLVYVNPVTGECRWDLEPGTFCLPQDPAGMWWEIEDEKSGGVCYYFNTKTKETTWDRPSKEDGLVIPLTALQESGASRRFSQYLATASAAAATAEPEEPSSRDSRIERSTLSDVAESETTVSPPASPTSTVQGPSVSSLPSSLHSSPQKLQQQPSQSTPVQSMSKSDTVDSFATAIDALDFPDPFGPAHRNHPTPSSPRPSSSATAAAARRGSVDSNATKTSHSRSKSWTQQLLRDRSPFTSRKSVAKTASPAEGPSTESPTKTVSFQTAPSSSKKHRRKSSVPSIKLPTRSRPASPTGPAVPPVPSISPVHLPSTNSSRSPSPAHLLTPTKVRQRTRSAEEDELMPLEGAAPPPRLTSSVGPSTRTKRLSTGDHRVLPSDLQSQLNAFSLGGVAGRHFAQRKSGFFSRKIVPLSQLASWQKAPLDAPLRDLDRRCTPDALKSFRLIQCIMGDRARSNSDNNSNPNSRTRAVSINCFEDWITDPVSVLKVPWSDAMVNDARDLLAIGIKNGVLRDEIYLQIMKQLTRWDCNPSMHALHRGWQLCQVVVCAFPPSRDLEPSVKQFFQATAASPPERSSILRLMAMHCSDQLDKSSARGPRGRAPTKKEILIRSMNAFNPRSFGESLEHAQSLQASAHADLPIPLVVVLMCNSLLSLGALRTEGVFRISADSEAVTELKASVDEGALHVDSSYDIHTVASALKVYFRDLPEPLIPLSAYQKCLDGASDIEAIHRIINELPLLRRRVLAFVITFLQHFLVPDAVVKTRMPAKSLAMVWAPNILRCESQSMHVAFNNTPHEQTFFYTLLKAFDPRDVDLEGFRPLHPYPVPVGPFQLRSSAMDLLN